MTKKLSSKQIAEKLIMVSCAQNDILYMMGRALQTTGDERAKYIRKCKLMFECHESYFNAILKQIKKEEKSKNQALEV